MDVCFFRWWNCSDVFQKFDFRLLPFFCFPLLCNFIDFQWNQRNKCKCISEWCRNIIQMLFFVIVFLLWQTWNPFLHRNYISLSSFIYEIHFISLYNNKGIQHFVLLFSIHYFDSDLNWAVIYIWGSKNFCLSFINLFLQSDEMFSTRVHEK